VEAAGPLKDGGRGLSVRAQRGSSPAVSEVVEHRREQRKGRRVPTRGPGATAREGKGGERAADGLSRPMGW
jgi:hypothetical protein